MDRELMTEVLIQILTITKGNDNMNKKINEWLAKAGRM